ncbi:MAG: methylenetetrahydrofolate reductase [NAD(P)H] [Bacteroidetes bacterium]|nr:methylenetetrahydrofolate reductase [NAD(P)H] [Bacteroidota bacterium]MBL0052444.1 methylenetetrahydrofolate reductase [NAD(P)H] [Bacteroidota bacterium]
MKVIDHIKQSKKTLFSIEILPPLKGKGIQSIFDTIDPLMEFKPPFIDVTYHREEYVYKKRDGGYLEKVSIRKRPGTVSICSAIKSKYNTEAVPHLICGGFTKEETENALIELNFLGIDNVLALRGDAIKTENAFIPTPGGHQFALDLVKQISGLNNGHYLDEDLLGHANTDFCIGIAGYPEKHFEAPNPQTDLMHLKQKVEAGAHYIVTQMFFDNTKFVAFTEACRKMNIDIPIIPGLKILTSKKQLINLAKTFHIDIPEDLTQAVMNCKNDEDVKQVGIEWCINQSKELIKENVPCLHYYTMGNPDITLKVAREVF